MISIDPKTLIKKDILPIENIFTVAAMAYDLEDGNVVYLGNTIDKKLIKVSFSSKKVETFPLEAPTYCNLKAINKKTLLYG